MQESETEQQGLVTVDTTTAQVHEHEFQKRGLSRVLENSRKLQRLEMLESETSKNEMMQKRGPKLERSWRVEEYAWGKRRYYYETEKRRKGALRNRATS